MAYLSDELIGIIDEKYGKQLWVLIKLRKPHKCQNCEDNLKIGDYAWRPLTNLSNRMERLCLQCGNFLAKERL